MDLMDWLDSTSEGGAYELHKRMEDYLRPLERMLTDADVTEDLFGDALDALCDGESLRKVDASAAVLDIVSLHVKYLKNKYGSSWQQEEKDREKNGWGRDPALLLAGIANRDAAWAVAWAKMLVETGQQSLLEEAATVTGIAPQESTSFKVTTPARVLEDIRAHGGPLKILEPDSALWSQLCTLFRFKYNTRGLCQERKSSGRRGAN